MSGTTTDTNAMASTSRIALQSATKTFAVLFKQAYLEASDEVRKVIASMSEIIGDPETSPDDQAAAMETLIEALFPTNGTDNCLGVDLENVHTVESADYRQERDEAAREDAAFALRLKRLMKARKMTQHQLAKAVGVGQPAISMMLNRRCRPQKKTVSKIADALGVKTQDLWPKS